MVNIELIYPVSNIEQIYMKLCLPPGATVAKALQVSQLFVLHPETKDLPIGIFAKRVSLDSLLKDGDRLEIYRPLMMDPKDQRRKLAKKQGKLGNNNSRDLL